MIGPGDKIDMDDYDDVGEYIADAMEVGYTMEAEDFEGRSCAYCGETIPFVDWPDGVVTWDTTVQEPGAEEPEPYVKRDYFCSEECRHDAMRDTEWLQNMDERADRGDRIHLDDLEGMA